MKKDSCSQQESVFQKKFDYRHCSTKYIDGKGGTYVFIDTKERGLIMEPKNPVNKPLYDFLAKHQPVMDGSRLYDDLIDVYVSQELDFEEGAQNEPIIRAV